MFVFLILSQFLQAQITMDHFIGVNLRREDPIQYLSAVGFVREYHDWAVDEGDWVQTTISNSSNSFTLPVPAPQPDNKYKFNPGFGTFTKFDDFYQKISDKVGSGNFCATMKSCLPYLSGGYKGYFLEFKPILNSNSGTITSAEKTNEVQFVFTPSVNAEQPSSYSWYSEWVYQFGLKYGNNPVTPTPLFKRYFGENNTTPSTFPKIKYMELWNEPDKYFFKYAGSKNTAAELAADGWLQATKFTGREFAAMSSAAYDANGSSAYAGIKNADQNIKIANGGTAGIREYDWKFLMDMKDWFATNRPGVMPFKVINFHHYNSNKWYELDQTTQSASPEEDRYNIGTLQNVDINGLKSSDENTILSLTNVNPVGTTNRTFKQRLIELKDRVNTNFSGAEVWLSEFGFDTNDNSHFKVPKLIRTDGTVLDDKQEVQGRFLVRAYLEIASAGFDRAMMFCIRDSKSSADAGLFDSNGLVLDNANGYAPKKSFYYVSTMKEALKNTKFVNEVTIAGDPTISFGGIYNGHSYNFTSTDYPRICKFQDQTTSSKITYAIWYPTKQDISKDFNFYQPTGTIATLISPKSGDYNGEKKALILQPAVDSKGPFFIVPATENPKYICVGQSISDLPVTAPDLTATGISCDAVAISINNFATNNTYAVYYYEKNDQDENGVVPTFNINDLNFKRYAPNSLLNSPIIVVGGLNLRLDNYFFYVIATDNLTGNVSTPTLATIKTTSCSNNVIKAIDISGTDSQLSGILNTDDYSVCYPLRNMNTLTEWVYNNSPSVGNIKLINNSGVEQDFNINLISLIDGTSEGVLKISYAPFSALGNYIYTSLPDYFTSSLYKWIHLPVNIIASRIKIERTDDNARISKIIFRGTPVGSAFATACCVANENPNILKIITGNTTVSAQQNMGNLLPYPNINARQVLKVYGTLIFDQNYSFRNNSLIYMMPGSKIIVNPNWYLQLINTSIQGCDQKWQGIEAQSGSSIDFQNTNIRDAEIGLKLKLNSTNSNYNSMWLSDCVFEENTVGIQNDYGTASNNGDFFFMSSTCFDSNNRYTKPDYSGTANPTYGYESLTGISLQNVNFQYFGYDTPYWHPGTNYFQNIATGINAYNSTLNIQNCVFKNIKPGLSKDPYFGTVGATGGYGLQMTSGKLIIDGKIIPKTGVLDNSFNFDKVTVPIYLYSTNFDIENCKMSTGVNNTLSSGGFFNFSTNYGGIYAQYDGGGACTIKNNTINANGSGITALYQQNPTLIDGNTIDCNNILGEPSNYNGQNIFALGSFSYDGVRYGLASNVFKITNNTLIMNYIKHTSGIFVNGIDGGVIENNKIYTRDYVESARSTDSTFMINIYNSTNSLFNKNTLQGLGGNGDNKVYAVGINLIGSTDNSITCNGIRDSRIGIAVDGNCASGTSNSGASVGIAGNLLDGYNRGLLLKNNTAITGVHSHKMNVWKNASSNNKAAEFLNDITDNNIQVANSHFFVGNNTNNGSNDSQINPSSISGAVSTNSPLVNGAWFIPEPVNNPYVCSSGTGFQSNTTSFRTILDEESEFEDPTETKYLNRNMVENSEKVKKSLNISDASSWIMERDAFNYYKNKLKDKVPTVQSLKDFFKKHETSDIGVIAQIEKEWANLNEIELKSERSQMLYKDAQLSKFLKNSEPIDPKKISGISDRKTLQNYTKSVSSDSISILHFQLTSLQKTYSDGIVKKAKRLLDINSQLSDKLDYVRFEKEVNTIYFTMLSNNSKTISKKDADRIKTIAMMCPDVAGRAPYKARSVYAIVSASQLPEWNCTTKATIIIKDLVSQSLNLTLFPNPANDNITFTLDEVKVLESYTWQIYDLTGRSLKSGIFTNFSETVKTSDLSSGVYLLQILRDNGIVKTEKFTLIKN